MTCCTKYGKGRGPCCNCNFQLDLNSMASYFSGDKYVSNRSKISTFSDNKPDAKYIDKMIEDKLGDINNLYEHTIDIANGVLEKNETRNSLLKDDMQELKDLSTLNDSLYTDKIQNLLNKIEELETKNLELLKVKNIRETQKLNKSEKSETNGVEEHNCKDIEELKKSHAQEIELLNQIHNEKFSAAINEFNIKLENSDIEWRDNIKSILNQHKDAIEKMMSDNDKVYEEFTEITNKLIAEKDLENKTLQEIIANNDFVLCSKDSNTNDINKNEGEENLNTDSTINIPSTEKDCKNERCLAIKAQNIALKRKLIRAEKFKDKCLKCLQGQYFELLKEINIQKTAFNLTWMKKDNEVTFAMSDDADMDIQNLRNDVHNLEDKYNLNDIQKLRDEINRLDEKYKKISQILKSISKTSESSQ